MTTAQEPEWDDRSRAWALAEQRYDDSLCPRCGQPASICQNPENEGRFDVEAPVRCFMTTDLIRAQEQYGDDVPQREALIWTLPGVR